MMNTKTRVKYKEEKKKGEEKKGSGKEKYQKIILEGTNFLEDIHLIKISVSACLICSSLKFNMYHIGDISFYIGRFFV